VETETVLCKGKTGQTRTSVENIDRVRQGSPLLVLPENPSVLLPDSWKYHDRAIVRLQSTTVTGTRAKSQPKTNPLPSIQYAC